ncbi:hypothetical protein [Pseudomonas huanghezhanensis]|uniref:hypothetical protein n=1 Tax=Pseudomonas huanghezhanensis TaxID=3002903 RepID=UPI0038B535CD
MEVMTNPRMPATDVNQLLKRDLGLSQYTVGVNIVVGRVFDLDETAICADNEDAQYDDDGAEAEVEFLRNTEFADHGYGLEIRASLARSFFYQRDTVSRCHSDIDSIGSVNCSLRF